MYILVDNSLENTIIFHYYLDTDWVLYEVDRDRTDLIVAFDNFLIDQKKTISDLKGLAVVIGKGKFTATRVAVTLVNTLAYVLKIPVIPANDLSEDLVFLIQQSPVGQYVSAQYSAPANVGSSKK